MLKEASTICSKTHHVYKGVLYEVLSVRHWRKIMLSFVQVLIFFIVPLLCIIHPRSSL